MDSSFVIPLFSILAKHLPCPPPISGRWILSKCLMEARELRRRRFLREVRVLGIFRVTAGPPTEVRRLAILRAPGDLFVSLPAFDNHGRLTLALARAQMLTWSLPEADAQLRKLSLQW